VPPRSGPEASPPTTTDQKQQEQLKAELFIPVQRSCTGIRVLSSIQEDGMPTEEQAHDVIPENLIESEAALYLRVRPSTLAKWRTRGEGPDYSKIGGRVVYTRQQLRDFVQARSRAAGKEPALQAYVGGANARR
jgi:hypothetical protein